MKVNFVCMAQYDAEMPNVTVAYPPEELKMTFGEYISQNDMTQLRIAETQNMRTLRSSLTAVKKSSLRARIEFS